MPEEIITKDFVDREILHERELTDEKFKSRDKAIELLASKVPTFLSIVGVLLAALALALPYLKSR